MKYFRNISRLTFRTSNMVKNRFCNHLIIHEKGKGVLFERRPVIEGIATDCDSPLE